MTWIIIGIAGLCLAFAVLGWSLCAVSGKADDSLPRFDVGPDGLWDDESYGGTDD